MDALLCASIFVLLYNARRKSVLKVKGWKSGKGGGLTKHIYVNSV